MMDIGQRTYASLASIVVSSPLASSGLIFCLSLPSLLFSKYDEEAHNEKTARRYPLWTSLLLLVSSAVEFPLISALHPVTIAYAPKATASDPPSPALLALQVVMFSFIEAFCRAYLLPPVVSIATQRSQEADEADADNATMAAVIMDFLAPRVALMMGVAIIGIPSGATRYLRELHPFSVTCWVIVDQNLALVL